jgi:hypothetical protein
MPHPATFAGLSALIALLLVAPSAAAPPIEAPAPLPLVQKVEAQPLLAQAQRVAGAMEYLGSPFSEATKAALAKAAQEADPATAVRMVQEALDPYCLLAVGTGPESPLTIARGPAAAELVEHGWRQFLDKVYNESGRPAQLTLTSPNAGRRAEAPAAEIPGLWLDLRSFNSPPMTATLSGLELEYRIIQLYSRVAGERTAALRFNVAEGAQELHFRIAPSYERTFRILDENGKPATASFIIRDSYKRPYPTLGQRLAPDFFFQDQVYRGDGEKERLPAGVYTISYGRGPEYLVKSTTVTLGDGPQTLDFALERWIDPSRFGWWSGDPHIHAAGCSHYTNPTEGVFPADMIRHCLGEDLKVGLALTWGEGFDFQKQFFTGGVADVSQFPHLLRYDLEVSGFGSHQSGHICLLRLKEQIYPGGTSTDHWPTLGLNTLKWAKSQGAICGIPHSGNGLDVGAKQSLPNYVIPPYNDNGANEYIVDVTHEVAGPDGKLVPAIDFMASMDTAYVWELNMWYHTLNCGFRTRLTGESDFPCKYDEQLGSGRTYVKLDGELDLDQWLEGIRAGRSYVSDGRSHLMEFRVGDAAMGEKGSELLLAQPSVVRVTAKVAALLNEQPNRALRRLPYTEKPWWHLERARLGDTREVPVEVVVNGYPVARQAIVADGQMREVAFDVPIERSSWVALRILPASHTNPVFVLVGGKPIRASRRSADWCLKGVDQCWSQKKRFIAAGEMADAEAAYEHARQAYRRILGECEAE